MPPTLIETNRLINTDDNIWRLELNSQFEYTDGDAYENFLKKLILNTHDLSAQSPELVKKYAHWDWVSEYHLSSQRANLLRSLDMNGIGNALELGCGCGAITRYIGELGVRVDAIEGAPRRAEIARYRCSDLENVNIINTNFNELTYPTDTYDAVLLIGVMEYAKKFQPTAVDHRDAVLKILSFATSTVKRDGVVIIAIENRLGLKYWLGASEDHYGRSYTGLYGYPQQKDIRTYDRKEWRKILDDMGTGAYRFAYPFPDYKLPRVVLFDDFIKRDAFAYSSLYGISSRDYLKLWEPDADEYLIWKSLHESGYLADFANSFLIVCSGSVQRLDRIAPNDFVYFSNADRKPAFRTITRKPQHQDYIFKKKLIDQHNNQKDIVKQDELQSPYIRGRLLSTVWSESIADTNDTDTFENLLKTYYTFVCDYVNNGIESFDSFDILPSNIIVDDFGSYRIIDEEWVDRENLSPQYIFFKALMWFSQTNHHLLQCLCEQKNINNVKEFIEYGFGLFTLDLDLNLDEFIKIEDQIQAHVVYQNGLNPVRRMIMEPFQHDMICRPGSFVAKLYWENQNREFNDNNSIVVTAPLGKKRQVLVFNLFYGLKALRHLRLNPVNRPGFFKLFSMTLKWIPLEEDKPQIIWQLKSADEIAKKTMMEGMYFTKAEEEKLFLSTSDHPLMMFELPSLQRIDILNGRFQFEVEMDWPKSEDIGVAERLLGKVNEVNTVQVQKLTKELSSEIQNHKEKYVKYLKKNQEKKQTISELSHQVNVLQDQVAHAKTSFNAIVNSKSWKCLKPLRRVSALFHRLVKNAPSRDSLQVNTSFEVIERSKLFDPSYYLEQNPELRQSKINLLRHYIDTGAKIGKNPNYLFESQYYIDNHPEVVASNINPFMHYLETGSVDGRSPHPLFDTAYYLGQNPEIEGSVINPLVHYIEFGAHASKNPHPLFDTAYYLDQNKDIAESGVNPLVHYLSYGAMEGRFPHPLFDTAYYTDQNPIIAQTGINPLVYYLTHTTETHGNPHPLFDTAYYLAQNPDVLPSGSNPLMHYLQAYPLETKNPHPLFDTRYYISQDPKGLLSDGNPLVNYLKTNNQTIKPHPLFDTEYYLTQNSEVAASGINPLVHYIINGSGDKKTPHPLFDSGYYANQNPDVTKNGINPMVHYITAGVIDRKNPHPLFDTAYYLSQNPEADKSGIYPIIHYIEKGAPNEKFSNRMIEDFQYKPKIGIIKAVTDKDENILHQIICSVAYQIYGNWEFYLLCDISMGSHIKKIVERYTKKDPRIKIQISEKPRGTVDALNSGLSMVCGEHILFLSGDDKLTVNALYEYVKLLNENNTCDLIYSDEDNMDIRGNRIEGFLDAESQSQSSYHIGHLILFRKSRLVEVGRIIDKHERFYDHDFLLRFLKEINPNRICYISKQLYY